MKKRELMKKMCAGMAVVLSLSTVLVGCGNKSIGSGGLARKWVREVNIQDIIDSTSESNQEAIYQGNFTKVVDLDELNVEFTLNFTLKTYKISASERKFEKNYQEVLDRYEEKIKKRMIRNLKEADEKDGEYKNLKERAVDSGYSSTEEMINDFYEVDRKLKLEQFETLITEWEKEGNYKYKDGKLYFSKSKDKDVDMNNDYYADYTVSDTKLVLKTDKATETYIAK